MNLWLSVVTHLLPQPDLAGLLLDALLKSVVILVVAGGVCIAWRRAAASTRHLVWLLAMLGLLLGPGFSRLLPGWQRPLWSVRSFPGSQNELTLTLELLPGNAAIVRPGSADAAVATPAAVMSTSGSDRPAWAKRLTTHVQARWASWVLIVWSVGACVILLWVVLGRLRLRAVRREARPVSEPKSPELLAELCRQLRIRRPVELLQSSGTHVPVTWGWWRPVILLPGEAEAWSCERRRVVLLHELGHVMRWDCLTQVIARLACAVYWFNPLVWVAARRLCIERERACDDLVLNGGCKASDYAAHLVEIARTVRRVPQVAAIAMARSSGLHGRVAAILDATRARRAPRALLVGLCSFGLLAFVAAVAAQKVDSNTSAAAKGPVKRWFDSRLRAFFTEKAAQARRLAEKENRPLAPEVWPYFEAGMAGDWQTATNLWWAMRQRAGQYEGTQWDERICNTMVWSTILETDLAWEQFANWKEKYVLAFGNDIINSIPPGSIYFGGTDPGRGVITAMSQSHVEGKPFFTLTQNALADTTYLEYLRTMYGAAIYTPTDEDSKKAFDDYGADAQRRLAENKLKPGEDVQTKDGKVQVRGQIAVMSINGLLAKITFDHNPKREFYIEESFPLEWMYPHLSPEGLVLKIHRQPLPTLSEEVVQRDHEYWSRYVAPILGDWLNSDTSVAQVAAFCEKVYLRHDLAGFKGDPQFIEDTWAQKAFSKLRSSIGGVYAWRRTDAKPEEEKQRMTREADFAFRQAFALCPSSPEALFRYVNLLLTSERLEDARLLAETSLKLDPNNATVRSLLEQLKKMRPQK